MRIVSKENCQYFSKILRLGVGKGLAAQLLLSDGRFHQTPDAPDAKAAFGPADQQIWVTDGANCHNTAPD